MYGKPVALQQYLDDVFPKKVNILSISRMSCFRPIFSLSISVEIPSRFTVKVSIRRDDTTLLFVGRSIENLPLAVNQ